MNNNNYYLDEILRKKKMRIIESFMNMGSGRGYDLVDKHYKVILSFPTNTKEEVENFVIKHFSKRRK
jgi:hypothetical protein